MKDDLMAWFHCGHCASLFKSAAGESHGRRCALCGEDPSLGLEMEISPAAVKGGVTGRDPMLRVKMAEVEKPQFYTREVRREKQSYFVYKLVFGWACAMGLLALAAHFFWKDEARQLGGREVFAEKTAERALADEDVALLNKAYPKCVEVMSAFINAGTPEERNQFVRHPVETASRMARFYQLNPIANIDPHTMRGSAGGIIHFKDGVRAVETRWQTTDGRELDAVFFDERGEWRLDWEEYARYGDQPLALFLTDHGPGEGEFRVYAREKMAEQRSAVSSLRIVLYAPRFGYPGEVGQPSPEFVIDQDSDAGRLIKAALSQRLAGKRIYGSNLPNHDADGMIRLRVKIRREESPLGREFKIEEVIACHWLSLDDPGVEK